MKPIKRKSRSTRVVFIDGKRLYLRAPQESDLPFLVRWFNNPAVRVFLSIIFPMTYWSEKKWLEKLPERTDVVVLIIVLKGRTPKQDRPIGTMGLHDIDYRNGLATTGAAIGEEDCWGERYGTEAKMLLLEYAFNTLNLRKICSRVYSFNSRSLAYSKKCGYVLEATLPKHRFRMGRYVDEHILAVYADTWRALWEKVKRKYLPV